MEGFHLTLVLKHFDRKNRTGKTERKRQEKTQRKVHELKGGQAQRGKTEENETKNENSGDHVKSGPRPNLRLQETFDAKF